MDDAEPFVDQETAAWLSLAIHNVRSRTSNVVAATSICAMIPVSSKSKMDRVPRRLFAVTRALATRGEKRWRQTTGADAGLVASHTPPMPT
jgi:hypothetical protein